MSSSNRTVVAAQSQQSVQQQAQQQYYAPQGQVYQGAPVYVAGNQQMVTTQYMSPMGQQVNMVIPTYQAIEGVPYGLEPLQAIDSVIVQQQVEILEVMMNIETNNRYNVMNGWGQRMYYAAENTECCTRMCCGTSRPFLIYILDGMGKQVLVVERPCNCSLWWWGGETAGSSVTVKLAATGELIGTVQQNCNCCSPSYEVLDEFGNSVLDIKGPGCASACPCLLCCDAQFHVYCKDGTQCGNILKSFAMKELVSDANNFGVQFPPDLHPKMKATLLAAVFCIDFSFFERSNINPPSGCSCLIWLIVCGAVLGLIIYLVMSAPKENDGYGHSYGNSYG